MGARVVGGGQDRERSESIRGELSRIDLGNDRPTTAELIDRPRGRPWWWLGLEKVPFLVMSVFFSLFLVSGFQEMGTIKTTEDLGLFERVCNSVVHYGWYLQKAFWPSGLAAYYPLERDIDWWRFSISAGVILVVSILAVVYRKRWACLVTGWLWFLAVLLPVIGLVQVSSQATADRYAHLPLTGIAIIVAGLLYGGLAGRKGYGSFGAAGQEPEPRSSEGTGSSPVSPLAPQGGGNDSAAGSGRLWLSWAVMMAMMSCFTAISHRQSGFWTSRQKLFEHAIAVTEGNYVAYDHVGHCWLDRGRPDLAARYFDKAIEAANYNPSRINLSLALIEMGGYTKALQVLDHAILLEPNYPVAFYNRGIAHEGLGQVDKAIDDYRTAMEQDPEYYDPLNNLAVLYVNQQQPGKAAALYRQAIERDPGNLDAVKSLIELAIRQSQPDEALRWLARVEAQIPVDPELAYYAARAWHLKGELARAMSYYQRAREMAPGHADTCYYLAELMLQQQQVDTARLLLTQALQLAPDHQKARALLDSIH